MRGEGEGFFSNRNVAIDGIDVIMLIVCTVNVKGSG